MAEIGTAQRCVARSVWAETTIGSLCDRFGGEVQTGPFGSQLHAADYSPDGIPVVMPQDVRDGCIVYDRIARVAQKHANRLKRHILRTGDIVYSRRGDVSRFAVVTSVEDGWLCGTGSIRIRLNCPHIDIRYVRRYLQQDLVKDWLQRHAKGLTMPNLNTEIVRALPFAYGPIAEQQRIATLLDRVERLRAKRRAALAQLDKLSQSAFLDLFGDPSKNTRQWPMTTIRDVAEQVTDGEHLTPKRTTTGIKLLSARNVRDGYLDFTDVDYIGTEEYERIKRRCNPSQGDILISCSGTIGRVATVETDEPFSLVRSVALVRPRVSVIDSKFLEHYLRTPALRANMLSRANASSQANLFQNQIRTLPVYLPPLPLQHDFRRLINSLQSLKARYSTSHAEIDALFCSVQHRAFHGEL